MRVVLVTGASGFIGRYVCRELDARSMPWKPYDLPDDVRDLHRLNEAMEDACGVIHLAGVLGTSELLSFETDAVHVNVLGALNVLNAAVAARVPMVQIGTGHKGQPNTYAITKACAEDLLLARAQWLGHKVTVVRAFHAYGAGQPPPAPFGKGHAAKIVPVFACRAITGRPLQLHGGGLQVVDMVHAASVARLLVDALGGPYGQVVDAGTGVGTTVQRVAEDILIATGATHGRTEPWAPRIGEPKDAVVVAADPAVPAIEAWPWQLSATLDYYRTLLHAGGMTRGYLPGFAAQPAGS